MNSPEALILAGPNGAGKTTSSAVLVPASTLFLNSDVIASRLREEGRPPGSIDVAAGRIILGQLQGMIDTKASFCIETNLAGRGLLHRIGVWRTRGYTVRLTFTALDSPELALSRVATRVSLGGHDVPEAVVRRRWAAGLRSLFDLYIPVVDRWLVFDSSDSSLRLVAEGDRESSVWRILDEERWSRLVTLAAQAGASVAQRGREFF